MQPKKLKWKISKETIKNFPPLPGDIPRQFWPLFSPFALFLMQGSVALTAATLVLSSLIPPQSSAPRAVWASYRFPRSHDLSYSTERPEGDRMSVRGLEQKQGLIHGPFWTTLSSLFTLFLLPDWWICYFIQFQQSLNKKLEIKENEAGPPLPAGSPSGVYAPCQAAPHPHPCLEHSLQVVLGAPSSCFFGPRKGKVPVPTVASLEGLCWAPPTPVETLQWLH